jgi:putative ABC transport system permease protein
MLLAHAMARDREMSVRAALGRLAQQLLTESLVLAAVGGLLGLVIARGGVQLLVVLAASSLPRTSDVSVDTRALVATIAITGFTGILFGIFPAWRVASRELAEALRHGGRGATEGPGPRQTRRLLVASQFALALMLLIGAGLLIRSFVALQSRDPGFDPRNLLTAELSVTGTASSPPGSREAFYRAVLAEVGRLPGVASVSAVNHLPIGGDSWGWPFRVEGRAEPAPGDTPVASYKVVWPGYFGTMGIPLLSGRDVAETDRLGTPGVVVVNRFLAEQYWPGENAVGKRIAFERDSARQPIWLTVIGVVGNTIHGDWAHPPEEEAYLPFLQHRDYLEDPRTHFAYVSLAIRASCDGRLTGPCDAAALAPSLRTIAQRLDPDVPVSQVRTMHLIVEEATGRERFYLVLLATFAGVALVLAAAGVYGVMSYLMARRVREIGVRIALGARPASLRWRMTAEGLRLAAIGGGIGLIGAFVASRTMSALLVGVTPTDAPAFLAGVAVLALAAVVACYLPARRATRIDPLDALRSE